MHLDRPSLRNQERPAVAGLPAEARAERLLAEYLRRWGLRDPSAIAARCRRWVQSIIEDQGAPQSLDGPEDPLARAALGGAMSDMDQWLDHLALLVASDPTEAAARRGLLAMEMQTVIDHHPQALLQYEVLPEALWQQLRAAARPVVPPAARPTRMQGPPLGELPPLLQPQQWRRFFGWLAAAILIVVGHRRGI